MMSSECDRRPASECTKANAVHEQRVPKGTSMSDKKQETEKPIAEQLKEAELAGYRRGVLTAVKVLEEPEASDDDA